MGPRPFGRGRHDEPEGHARATCSFNGATAFRPWKTTPTSAGGRQVSNASMGPRPFGRGRLALKNIPSVGLDLLQWGHGLSAVEDRVGRTKERLGLCRFNGATAFRPWK